MAFIQLIEYRTSNADERDRIGEQWEQATEGRRTARRVIITRDRNDPDRYVDIVFFDSYESAMENSALPETAAFAEQLTATLDGPPSFLDLDVITDRT